MRIWIVSSLNTKKWFKEIRRRVWTFFTKPPIIPYSNWSQLLHQQLLGHWLYLSSLASFGTSRADSKNRPFLPTDWSYFPHVSLWWWWYWKARPYFGTCIWNALTFQCFHIYHCFEILLTRSLQSAGVPLNTFFYSIQPIWSGIN
jgi:hypothetical protein